MDENLCKIHDMPMCSEVLGPDVDDTEYCPHCRITELEKEHGEFQVENQELMMEVERGKDRLTELDAKLDRKQRRGDNHMETLRSIAKMNPQTEGDRMVLWANDGLSGYTESNETTMGQLRDRITELGAIDVEKERQLCSMAATSDGFQLDLAHAMERIAELENERDGIAEQARREIADILNGKIPTVEKPIFDPLTLATVTLGRARVAENQLTEANALLAEVVSKDNHCMNEDIDHECWEVDPDLAGRIAAHLETKGEGK